MASYRSIFIVFFLATHFHLLHCLQRVPNLQVAVDPYNEAADTSPEPETTGDGKRKKKGSKEKESKKKESTKGGSKPKNDRPLVSHSVVLQLMPTYDGAPRDIPWDQLVAILYKAFFEMKGLPETWPRQSMCIMHIGHEIFLASSVEGPTEKWLAKEGPAELMKADLRLNVGSRHRRGGRCCELNVLRLYFENPALQRGDDSLRRAKFAAAGPKLDKNKNPIPGTVEVYTPCPDEHFSGRFGCQTMFNTLNSRPPNDRFFASIEPLKNKDNIAPAPGIDDDILITPINYRQIAKTKDEFGPDLFSNEDLSQFDPKKVPGSCPHPSVSFPPDCSQICTINLNNNLLAQDINLNSLLAQTTINTRFRNTVA